MLGISSNMPSDNGGSFSSLLNNPSLRRGVADIVIKARLIREREEARIKGWEMEDIQEKTKTRTDSVSEQDCLGKGKPETSKVTLGYASA